MRRILYVQYTNPAGYPPLEHSSRMLADAGWEVLFLGTGALGAGALRFPPHRNIEVRQMPVCRAGWRQKLHYVRFCFWVLAVALRWRPKWVYASDPFSCPVSLLLNCIPRLGIVYHEHDSPEPPGGTSFLRFVFWCRRVLAHRAAFCVLPNEQRVERFAKEMGVADVLCVWNCPGRDEISSERQFPDSRDGLSVLYHGSVVPMRLPKTVLEAMAILHEHVRLRVIGYETVGHTGYIRELKETANRLGVANRLEFLGTLATRREVLDWCRKSDLGLSLMPALRGSINEQNMVGASNKAFDCMACGLPLLVSDVPDWRATYVDPGYAIACVPEDPNSIAAALRWFLENPTKMRAMGEEGRRRIAADWNYETQFAPVWRRIATDF